MDLVTNKEIKVLEERIKKLEGQHKTPLKAKVAVKTVKKPAGKSKRTIAK
jgi:hypothetical protein